MDLQHGTVDNVDVGLTGSLLAFDPVPCDQIVAEFSERHLRTHARTAAGTGCTGTSTAIGAEVCEGSEGGVNRNVPRTDTKVVEKFMGHGGKMGAATMPHTDLSGHSSMDLI